MEEYIENGGRLGWLINPEGALASDEETSSAVTPQDAEVEIYRPQQAVEIVAMPAIISGEAVLPGFELQV